MLIIQIKKDLRIIPTKFAWETQELKVYNGSIIRWEVIAHNSTLKNAFIYIREKLMRESDRETLSDTYSYLENLITEAVRSHTDFIQSLISCRGHEKINKYINELELAEIE